MRRIAGFALVTVAILAPPAVGQGGEPPAPPPDRWLTLDSLTTLVGLTAEQRGRVAEPYTALNAVLKQAANRRAALRAQFQRRQGAGAPGAPGTPPPAPTPEQRARADSLRAEFQALQDEADFWHGAIRDLLTPDQHAQFDALPRPRVLGEMRRRGG